MAMDTKTKLIEAAYLIFMQQGYNETGTKQIAELAGVNESTLFRIFKTKKNLFQYSIAHFAEKALDFSVALLAYDKDLRGNLYEILHLVLVSMKEVVPAFRLLVKQDLIEDQVLLDIQAKLNNYKRAIKQYLTGLVYREMMKVTDCDILAEQLYGLIFYQSIRLGMLETAGGAVEEEAARFCGDYAQYLAGIFQPGKQEVSP